MSKLKKCASCNHYTLKDSCPKCNEKTKDAHYKFIKIRNAPTNNSKKE